MEPAGPEDLVIRFINPAAPEDALRRLMVFIRLWRSLKCLRGAGYSFADLRDICLVLDIEDTHVVTYAIRKLQAAGLLTTGRTGKEKTVKITERGAQACKTYAEVRKHLLVDSTANARPAEQTLSETAAILRFISGAFNQAARAAATL